MKINPTKSAFLSLFALVMCLGVLLTGCQTQSSSALTKIKQQNTLVVGTSADYPPFEFEIVKNGKQKIVGYDVLLAQVIAKDLGVKKVKVINLPFPSLINELQDHKVDVVMAGMVYTKQRAKVVSFSQTYHQTTQDLLVSARNATKYQSQADLKNQTIGAQQSSEQETIAKGIKGAKVVSESSLQTLTQELKNGTLNGLVVANTAAQAYVAEHPDQYAIAKKIKFAVNPKLSNPRIIVRKSDPELLKKINQTLTQAKKTGQLEKLFKAAQNLQFSHNK